MGKLTVGLNICTACGEFYRYRGSLHCPIGSPVTVQPKPDWVDEHPDEPPK